MRQVSKWLIFGLVGMSTISLTGCGTAGTPARGSQSLPPGPLPSATTDANDPYNAFLADDFLTINSARMELEYKCYAANGYPEFLKVLPAQKADAFRSMALTPDFKSTFASYAELPWFPSEDYARAAGFGHPTPGQETFVSTSDASFTRTAQDCEAETLATISGSAELIGAYTALGNSLAEALATAARANKGPLTKDVFACMNKGEYPVDEDGSNKQDIWGVDFGVPYGKPAPLTFPDLSKGGAVQIVPAIPEGPYIPTSEESNAAVAMYRCSVESGAQVAWQRTMNDAKQKALSENEATLTELNPKIQALAKSASLAVQNQP